MKVLFDQGTPVPLRNCLEEHEVDTLWEKGWSEKSNGELLDLAEFEGFGVLVTTDQSLCHQQNMTMRNVAVVVLLGYKVDRDSAKNHRNSKRDKQCDARRCRRNFSLRSVPQLQTGSQKS